MCGCGLKTLEEFEYHCIPREWLSDSDPHWTTGRFNRWMAWLYLLHRAEKPTRQGEVELDRGEFHVSVSILVKRWEWGRATVHKFLKDRESFGDITRVRKLKTGTTYRILDYDSKVLPEDHEICRHCGLPDIKTPNTPPNSKRDTKRDTQTTKNKSVTFYVRTVNRTASGTPSGTPMTAEPAQQMEIEGLGTTPTGSKPSKRATNRALALGDGLPDIPEDLDTLELRRALELRIRERASRRKKFHVIPESLEALYDELRIVQKVRGKDHVVACIRRATKNGYQATVFPEDLEGEPPGSAFNPPASMKTSWRSRKI